MREWKIEEAIAERCFELRFGGVWERLVISAKKAIYNVLGTQNLNEDILRTIICSVEKILNHRPLAPDSDDIEIYEVITQNHFLIGSSGSEMFRIYSKEYECRHRNLKAAQSNANRIWHIFQKEYIPMHLARTEWFKKSKNEPNEGDLVWIVEQQIFTDKFHLRRTEKLNYSDDGIGRSAEVKTKTGVYKRPII